MLRKRYRKIKIYLLIYKIHQFFIGKSKKNELPIKNRQIFIVVCNLNPYHICQIKQKLGINGIQSDICGWKGIAELHSEVTLDDLFVK